MKIYTLPLRSIVMLMLSVSFLACNGKKKAMMKNQLKKK